MCSVASAAAMHRSFVYHFKKLGKLHAWQTRASRGHSTSLANLLIEKTFFSGRTIVSFCNSRESRENVEDS